MHCVLYARSRATNKSEEAANVRRQLQTMRTFARARKLTVDGEFTDRGLSARDMERQGLRNLVEFCNSRAVDVVVVSSGDRLFRTHADYVALRAKLEKRRTKIISLSGDTMIEDFFVGYFRSLSIKRGLAVRERRNATNASDRNAVLIKDKNGNRPRSKKPRPRRK